MHSSLSDPNNHVPGISPGDSWHDDDESGILGSPSIGVLPPRRMAADRSSAETLTNNLQSGLRIVSNVSRAAETDSPRRIEVQEISGAVIRLEESVPTPPRVARQVAFHERGVRAESEKNPRGEGREWGLADQNSKRWLLGAGVTVGVIVILSMVLLPMFNEMNATPTDPDKGSYKVENEEKIEGMEALDRLLLKQTEAMQIFRSYTQASRFEDIVPLLRDGTAMKEILRAWWRPMGISRQWSPAPDSAWTLVELEGHPCAVLEGNLPDHSKFAAYFTNEGNRLLLDWKATSGFGTASFGDLKQNKGDPTEIRGLISAAEFYNSAWPEADYQSYRLVSPDGENAIWCYARRDNSNGARIGELFRKGEIVEESQSSRKITLRLGRGSEDAQSNQWLIGEMLHIDWLAP